MKKEFLSNMLELQCDVKVVLGETEMPMKDVKDIAKGTIIELPERAGEPVTLEANGRAIAKGEVVVIDEQFGIRVTEVFDDREPQEV